MRHLVLLICVEILLFGCLCFADPIPGGGGEAVITATVTGEVTANAGTDLNTSALATSAKQDTLLTELQLKADLTETQPVSIEQTGDNNAVDVLTLPNVTIGTFPDNEPLNVAQINGATPLMGNGATGTGSPRVTIANDNTDIPVKIMPQTSGGWSTGNFTSGDGSTALTNSAQVIKASAGQLGGWHIFNPNTVTAWVIIYNVAAASVTVGTTNPQMVLGIPAGAAANVEFSIGIPFSTAMSCAAVMTTAGGNTAPTTALDVMILYK